MSEIAESELSAPVSRRFGLPLMAWVALGLAGGMQTLAAALIGVNAGLFFAGIVLATLIVPPMCLTESRLPDRAVIAWAANDGIGLVWFVAVFASPLTLEQWFLCYVVLLAWTMLLMGLSVLAQGFLDRLDSIGRRKFSGSIVVAPAIVVLIALAWVSCPVWLAPIMPAHPNLTHWIIWIHPLMACNSVVREFGLWMERPIAYRYLLTLGQDVSAGLPQSVLPSFVFHFVLGIAALGLSRTVGKR
jgi:hypothetical protein